MYSHRSGHRSCGLDVMSHKHLPACGTRSEKGLAWGRLWRARLQELARVSPWPGGPTSCPPSHHGFLRAPGLPIIPVEPLTSPHMRRESDWFKHWCACTTQVNVATAVHRLAKLHSMHTSGAAALIVNSPQFRLLLGQILRLPAALRGAFASPAPCLGWVIVKDGNYRAKASLIPCCC